MFILIIFLAYHFSILVPTHANYFAAFIHRASNNLHIGKYIHFVKDSISILISATEQYVSLIHIDIN